MGVGSGLYMYDVVVKRWRSLSHHLMSSCLYSAYKFNRAICAMRSNRLPLNSYKTEFRPMWCIPPRRRHQLPAEQLTIDGTPVSSVNTVRNLGVQLLDSDLSMVTHSRTAHNLSTHALLHWDKSVVFDALCQDPCCRLLPHHSLWQGLTTVTSSWQVYPSVNFNNCRQSSMLQHVWLPAHRSRTMLPRC